MNVRAILLAAGLSTRTGQKVSKLSLPWAGGTLLGAALRPLEEVGRSGVLVWSGEAPVVGSSWTLIENKWPDEGLSRSLQLGLQAIGDVDAALIALADMPFQNPVTLAELLANASTSGIVVSADGDRLGNPVVWGRDWFDPMMALTGDIGAKSLIMRNPSAVVRVQVRNPIELEDVDTWDDYERLQVQAVRTPDSPA